MSYSISFSFVFKKAYYDKGGSVDSMHQMIMNTGIKHS